MQTEPKSIEEIEQEIYRALMARVPDLPPYVARGLAKTAADKIRKQRLASQTPRQFPDNQTNQDHENDQK